MKTPPAVTRRRSRRHRPRSRCSPGRRTKSLPLARPWATAFRQAASLRRADRSGDWHGLLFETFHHCADEPSPPARIVEHRRDRGGPTAAHVASWTSADSIICIAIASGDLIPPLQKKRLPTEAALLFLSSLLHDLSISVNLTGNHEPSVRQIFQGRSFGFVLRQSQQTTAFFGLHPAMFCAVHRYFLRERC